MENKLHSTKLHHLDLAKRRTELEDIFESVIKRMPDLCMPPSYRYAGEDDHYNCTKSIKLIPFRKQSNFVKCVSPEVESSASSSAPLDSCSKKIAAKRWSNRGSDKRQNKDDAALRVGFDKLFKKIPSKNYPFANPIADCMLTDSNIDNLREIIVSSLDIEWKMLTPFRLDSEYEENYFDKLFQLHRNRYRSRLESGYFSTYQKAPFKHTRHAFLVQYGSHKRGHSPTNPGSNRKGETQGTNRPKEETAKLTIPTLTLTSDEKSSKTISNVGSDNEADDELDDYDYQEYSYENFSRYSLDNNMKYNSKSGKQSLASNDDEVELDFGIRQQDMNFEDELEDQVENIISHLISAD